MDRDAERVAERGTRRHPHPQSGERPGTDADDDGVEIGRGVARLGQALEDLRRQNLRVCAGVDSGPGRERPRGVGGLWVEAHDSRSDRRGGGVDGKHKHDVPGYSHSTGLPRAGRPADFRSPFRRVVLVQM